MKSGVFLVTLAVLCTPAALFAVPSTEEYQAIPKKGPLTLEGCPAVDDLSASTLRISRNKNKVFVALPKKLNRIRHKVKGAADLKFFACGTDDSSGDLVIYGRSIKDDDSTTAIIDLGNKDFKKKKNNNGGGGNLSGCGKVFGWNPAFIYKTTGSSHFSQSDPRRYTAGLIMKYGANVPVISCLNILAKNGAVVGNMGLYQTGNGWYARYYSGSGCGTGESGSGLASEALKAAGSSLGYLRLGSACYGPINLNSCIGSTQC